MKPNPINPFGLNASEPHRRENKTPEELETAECRSHGLWNCYHCTGRGHRAMIQRKAVSEQLDLHRLRKQIWKVRNELEATCIGSPGPGEPGRREHMEHVGKLQRQEAKLVRKARRMEKASSPIQGSSTVNMEMSRILSRFF